MERRTATIRTACAIAALTCGAGATLAQPDNVWIGAGVGLWIEFDFPASLVFDDQHYPAATESQHFYSELVDDINDIIELEVHLEANAGIDVPGVGSINVGKAGAWINDNPLAAAAAPLNLHGAMAGAQDVPLWEVPGNVDAMVSTTYFFQDGFAEFMLITPAPRILPDQHNVYIPVPGDPGFTFTPLGAVPFDLLNDIAQPVPGEDFFQIPGGALAPNSPPLQEIAAWTVLPPQPSAGCPCEAGGDPNVIDVEDLLNFLVSWFASGPDADINGDGITDVADLLDFLSCWFPAANGAPCIDVPIIEVDLSNTEGPYLGNLQIDPGLPPLNGPLDIFPPDVQMLMGILAQENPNFNNHVGYSFAFEAPQPMAGIAYHPNQSEWPFMNTEPFIVYLDFPQPAAWAYQFEETAPHEFRMKSWVVANGQLVDVFEMQIGEFLNGGNALLNGQPVILAAAGGGGLKCSLCKGAVSAVLGVGSFWAGLGCAAGIAAGGGPAIAWGTLVAAVEAFDLALGPQAICGQLGFCP